jgi:hypothetical protein
MMSKFVKLACLTSVLLAGQVMAQDQNITDPLNLAGTYQCTGHDSHDGDFTGDLTLTLNPAGSDIQHQQIAYQLTLKAKIGDDTSNYAGYAAASGNTLAVYFANENKQDKIGLSDHGVGTASVTHQKNSDGKTTTTLHKFYYLPEYKTTGGNGTEICVKVSAA